MARRPRVPPRRLAALLVLLWSCAPLALGLTAGVASLFAFRLLVGLMEAPSYPINNRVVTTWVPEGERAWAIGIYTYAQFVGLAFLAPVLSWLYTGCGWTSVFMASGVLGIVWAAVLFLFYRELGDCPGINAAELALICDGGGIPNLAERLKEAQFRQDAAFRWSDLLLLSRRKLWGLYLRQLGLGGTTLFFLTWFPTYLVQ